MANDAKRCPVCGIEKAKTLFTPSSRSKDGCQPYCRECFNSRRREKYQNDPTLRESIKEKTHKYYYANLDAVRKTARDYHDRTKELRRPAIREAAKRSYLNSREERIEMCRKWRQANRPIVNAMKADWRRRNKALSNLYMRIRNIRARANGGKITLLQWRELCELYGNTCLSCNKKVFLTADHIVPVSKGGTGNIDNIQPLCLSCNAKKNNRIVDYRIAR